MEKLEQARQEKEARQRELMEAKRRRQEELQKQRQEENLRKLQEREMKRQQAAMLKEQVRKRAFPAHVRWSSSETLSSTNTCIHFFVSYVSFFESRR